MQNTKPFKDKRYTKMHIQNPKYRQKIRKILVSVKFLSAILGPEMAAPIFWAPGKIAFLLQEKAMSIKFLLLGGGILGVGGGSADFIFMGARIFLKHLFGVVGVYFGVCFWASKGSILCMGTAWSQPVGWTTAYSAGLWNFFEWEGCIWP